MIYKDDRKMKMPRVLYAILDKRNNKVSICRYLNSEIPYILGVSVRKAQRMLGENETVDTETHTIYTVHSIDMGNRGGRRIKKEDEDEY